MLDVFYWLSAIGLGHNIIAVYWICEDTNPGKKPNNLAVPLHEVEEEERWNQAIRDGRLL